mmetsp:Transcript_19548/g.29245  ORF Transcript_19548/g.29245 Transcript_19548/m.29245 type:complete len:90 (-) Transcript_19548:53-322(-)
MIVERLGQHVVTQAADLVMQVDVRWGLARSSGNKDNHNHNHGLGHHLAFGMYPRCSGCHSNRGSEPTTSNHGAHGSRHCGLNDLSRRNS